MGKAATAFKDIGKACSDLLSKDFSVGETTIEVKSNASNGTAFTSKTTKSAKDNSVSGSLVGKKKFGKTQAEATVKTDGALKLQLEMAELAKGLKLTLDCETPKAGKSGALAVGKCTADYSSDMLTSKCIYDYYAAADKPDLCTAFSTAYQAFTLGCSADLSLAKMTLAKMSAACEYVADDFSLMFKYADSLGKPNAKTYSCSYFHSVSKDMQVGTEMVKDMSKPEVAMALGCAYKLDKDTTVKAKVDSSGMLSTSYKQKVSALTTMILTSKVDTVNLSDNKHKFGLTLNLTP